MSRFLIEYGTAVASLSLTDFTARGITADVLRGRSWHRTSHGFYRRSLPGTPADLTPAQRIADAVPLVPWDGAIGGWAAAQVHGADWLDGSEFGRPPDQVPVIMGSTLDRVPPDPRYFRGLLQPDEVEHHHGIAVTSLARTAFDCSRWSSSLSGAVASLDAMLHFTALSRAELTLWLPRVRGWRGVRRTRFALTLTDPHVRSVWESYLRVLYVVDAGLPVPLVNPLIIDEDTGEIVAEVDLLDPEAGLVLEYDGAHHRQREQHRLDNHREEALEALNLTVCRVDALDFAPRRQLIQRVRAARDRGLARDRRRDRWALTPARVLANRAESGRTSPVCQHSA